ncbi:MAG TPA: ABC transporter permease, partial [Blastocatellia bacterium]|nr:ABC transporter permease [Blastocatellia bacterium]
RMLLKAPGFTAVAIVTLALGIGANSAMFSAVNAVLLRPLPFADPDRLVLVSENNFQKGWQYFSVAPPNYADWRTQNRVFEDVGAMRGSPYNFSGGAEPERINGSRVTPAFFTILGVNPIHGRTFLGEEDQPGHDRVVVLSYGFWQRNFGSDQGILGNTIRLNGEGYTVVGIMPPDFQIPGRSQLWTPAAFTPEQLQNRGSHFTSVLARLKPRVSLETAQADLSGIATRLAEQYPATNGGWGVNVTLLHEEVVGDVRSSLLILLGAVGFVLLIACANVSNLLLTRATARHREIAIRAALGAGRWRIVRQLLTESSLLGLVGGALGLLLALWGSQLISGLPADTLPRAAGINVDMRVVGFTLSLALLTAMLFGIAPALQASRPSLGEALKEGGRSGMAGQGRHRLRSILAGLEVALAVVLSVGATLLVKSLWQLQSVDPGFRPEGLLTATVSLPQSKYGNPQQQVAFYNQALAGLTSVTDVKSAALCTTLPLGGSDFIFSFRTDRQTDVAPQDLSSANYYAISPDYFSTLGIRLLEGRVFNDQDSPNTTRVAIVNQTMANRFFPGESAIGRHLSMGINSNVTREIVGVVADVHHYGLDRPTTMQMYEPFAQQPFDLMAIVLRTDRDPATLAGVLRRQIQVVDKDQPVAQIRTGEEIIASAVVQSRFRTVLLGLFAGLALLLAMIGIYGVISYSANQRVHEIGVRLALGATRSDIVRLIVGHGMVFSIAGVVAGLAGAFGLTRFMSDFLFVVKPGDLGTFATIAILLTLVALLACYVPARRAMKVDPMIALRYE